MRQIKVDIQSDILFTPKSVRFNSLDFKFDKVTEDVSELKIPFSQSDHQLIIFGPGAQLCADFLITRIRGMNFQIRAGEFSTSKIRDLNLENYAYKTEISELKQQVINDTVIEQLQARRTITKQKIISTKPSRVYEISRCCFNEECKMSHGSIIILVVGDDGFQGLRAFAGGENGDLTFKKFGDRQFDAIACVNNESLDWCMEIMFLLGNK
ncbi:hypothetical protein SS50377_27844 [Spironucleus salmonicida]|uniref:Uncharacterized protein n=1 Tax=Spironucleus salmonicida TaxID=348837 RepID=V6LYN8_9EUKA|nr:hypothetical protein SS50377_27844 [Spironucleus salmonicida]|eukprot:EST48841.1 Hypothetical protein SS50377_10937 [Spironucleus salmonicida]